MSLTGGLVVAGTGQAASAAPPHDTPNLLPGRTSLAPTWASMAAREGIALAAQGVEAPASLAYGARGLAVKFLQMRLGVRPTSGWFGPLTRGAVIRWQRDHGLPATGSLTKAQYQRVFSQPVRPARSASARPASHTRQVSVSRSSRRAGAALNWAALARCESGGNPRAYNAAGYYGLYQFDLRTWRGLGGSGDPRDASPAEQTSRAQTLYSQRGASPWPVCGRKLYS